DDVTAFTAVCSLVSAVLVAIIAGAFRWIEKKQEGKAAASVAQVETTQEANQLAVEVLTRELERKTRAVERQDREIAALKVTNFLVLQHLTAVDRHFAEGKPPPPPAIPAELLERM